ncbi:MAG: methyl-accepting chemotaxis protein [Eubacteriales bacterium]
MKSIKLKLLLIFMSVFIILNAGIGILITNIVSKQLTQDAHDHLMDMAKIEADYVQARIEGRLTYISSLAQNPILLDKNITIEDKIAFFMSEAKRTDYLAFAFADKDGNATVFNEERETVNIASRDYFQKAISGQPAVSDLIISSATSELVLIFAAPVYENGEVVGVIYGRSDGHTLSEIVSDIDYKQTGYAYMINNQGVTVGHKNTDLVLAQDNDIVNMETYPELVELGELTKKMITRVAGSGEYTYNDIEKIVGYAPIDKSDWIIIFGIEKDEILLSINTIFQLLWKVFALACLFGVVVIYIASHNITKQIKKVTVAAKEISQGNFDVILSVKSKDEVGQLAEAFNVTLKRLKNYQGYIDEISEALLQISQGNLQITLEKEYIGQFIKLKDNFDTLTNELNGTLSQISQASYQVQRSSEQIATVSQTLSQGSTEQASAIQQLSASITEVAEQIQRNAANAKQAREKSNITGKELSESDAKMKELMLAMQQIDDKASEISKIIKIIDEIAFQTNILALNAAVEAARAGVAGKGFAVVADEVRNLASKSAEAAKSTSVLIEETIKSVQIGSLLAEKTAYALGNSAENAITTVAFVEGIAVASQEQASAVAQISQGIEQISTVVQSNATTAEQSATAGEALSEQSSFLKKSVVKFKLRNDTQTFR